VEGSRAGEPGELTRQFQYDLLGRQVALTDGNTNTTYFTYDALGRRVAESAPNSPSLVLFTTTYSPWDEVLVRSNLLGGVERRFYDSFGRLTNAFDAAGLSLSFQHDKIDRPVSTLWPNGSTENKGYTNALLLATRNRSGHSTEYAYDISGRKVLEKSPTGLTKTFGYDGLGRLVTESNSLGHLTRTLYDMFDKPTRTIQPDGLIQNLRYDAYGQVTNQFGAGLYPVVSQYDSAGNRTVLVDGNGNPTSWEYDGRNRVIRKTYADGTFYHYHYDASGNLRARRDARGITTSYQYDTANRLTVIDYPADPDVEFEYDALGRRTRMLDGSGTNRWYCDQAGRVLTNIQSRVNGTLVYEYNAEGSRTRMSVNNAQTAYAYDAGGRLSTISNAAGVFSYSWLPDANWVQSIVYPNGVVVSNTYNNIGWLAERRNLKPDATVISSFVYGYDAAGMRTNVLYDAGGTYSYGYDSMRQLTVARGFLPDGTANPNREFSYAYDTVGNRTAATNNGTTTVYNVNELNQHRFSITASGQLVTNVFGYDANGNMTLELLPTRQILYGWNEENRLAGVTNGAHRSEFVYNGLGFLVESQEYENGILQQITRRIYDNFLPVADVDSMNTPLRSYIRGLDLSLTFDRAGGIGGLLMLLDHQMSVFANYLSDANGNTIDLFGSDAGIAAHYEYDSFGNVLVAAGSLPQQPYHWSSKECHLPSQMSYYGFRWYRSDSGRWLTRDALGEVDGPNPFTFVNNNPINWFDAWGLKTQCGLTQGCIGWARDILGIPCNGPRPDDPSTGSRCFDTLSKAEEFPCPQSRTIFTYSYSKCLNITCTYERGPDRPYWCRGLICSPQWDYCWRDYKGEWNCGTTCDVNGVCKPQKVYKGDEHPWASKPTTWTTKYCVKCMVANYGD